MLADISGWDIQNVTDATEIIRVPKSMPKEQYDTMLISWANNANGVKSGVTFGVGNSKYTAGGAAAAARATLINTYGWIITDGGPV